MPGLTFVSFSYKRNGFASFGTKRREKVFVLFVAKENQKAFTGPNSHTRLTDSSLFVHEFLQSAAFAWGLNCRKCGGN